MPLGMLESFDAPVLNPNCELRSPSTVATQALLLMNNDFMLRQAEAFAAHVVRTAGADVKAQVRAAWRLALAREPTEIQVSQAVAFMERQTAQLARSPVKPGGARNDKSALAELCHALLCSNGFLYVD